MSTKKADEKKANQKVKSENPSAKPEEIVNGQSDNDDKTDKEPEETDSKTDKGGQTDGSTDEKENPTDEKPETEDDYKKEIRSLKAKLANREGQIKKLEGKLNAEGIGGTLLERYDGLIAAFEEEETKQRRSKRPYRFYFYHRRQLENLRRNFKKLMR